MLAQVQDVEHDLIGVVRVQRQRALAGDRVVLSRAASEDDAASRHRL